MYSAAVPVGEGSMWDELMGLVDPEQVTPEPTPEQPSIKSGILNDDGTYQQYGSRPSRSDPFGPPPGSIYPTFQIPTPEEIDYRRVESASWSLRAMGFQIVEEGDDISSVLGLTPAPEYQQPDGIWRS